MSEWVVFGSLCHLSSVTNSAGEKGMGELQNPFARIYERLDKARGQATHLTVLRAWALTLGVPATGVVDIARALMDLDAEVQQCKELAEKFIPGDKQKFIAPLERTQQLLKQMDLNAQWSSYVSYLDENTMLALEFGVYAMSQFHPATSPEKSGKIDGFVQKLDQLLAECLESEMTPALKKVFIKHLESIRAAILGFLVDGPEALEAAVDGAVGAMLRHGENIKSESETGKAFIADFFNVLGKVNDLVSGYQTTAQIASSAALTLLLPLIN